MSLKPICVPCRRFFRMRKGGYYFIEGMPRGNALPRAGNQEPHQWKPYKVWSGDLWECLGCGAQIVSGVALSPVSEHYMQNFETTIERLGADRLQVNDC